MIISFLSEKLNKMVMFEIFVVFISILIVDVYLYFFEIKGFNYIKYFLVVIVFFKGKMKNL